MNEFLDDTFWMYVIFELLIISCMNMNAPAIALVVTWELLCSLSQSEHRFNKPSSRDIV